MACGLSSVGHLGGPGRLDMTEARCPCTGLGDGRVQVGGSGAGRCCLRGMLLGLAQFGDRSSQGDELGHKGDG